MKINEKNIIFLASRHFFQVDNKQIQELIFELTSLVDISVKSWDNLDFDNFEPLFLPSFIKGGYLRPDNFEINEPKDDFLLNSKETNAKGYVFISKNIPNKKT